MRGHDRGHCEGAASCCASANPDKDVGVAQLKSWRCEIGLDHSQEVAVVAVVVVVEVVEVEAQ